MLIIGCGGLGSYVAEELTRSGVLALTLVDPDIVELSNLQRQTIFTESDAENKSLKVHALKKALTKINSNVKITTYPILFQEFQFLSLNQFDLVMDCSDNFLVRSLINDFCQFHKIPFVLGSVGGTYGSVALLNPTTGPNLKDAFPNLEELSEKDCDTLGVLTPLVPFVASLQVSLALRYFVSEVTFNKLYQVDIWDFTITTFTLKKHLSQEKSDVSLPEVKATCGGTFFGNWPTLTLSQLNNACQKLQLPFKTNPLGTKLTFQNRELTFFKNQRFFLYDFTSLLEAQEFFQQFYSLIEKRR